MATPPSPPSLDPVSNFSSSPERSDRLGDLEREITSIKKGMGDARARDMEILGVFVAVIAFVSGELQILKLNNPLLLVSLSFLLLGGLSFFISIFLTMLKGDPPLSTNKKSALVAGLSILFIILGWLVLFFKLTPDA